MIRFNKNFHPEFSNFHPCTVVYNGRTFQNAEAAFQSAKQKPGVFDEAFFTATGSEAKKMGRQVDLREDWNEVKFEVMCDVLYSKFNDNSELREALLSTGYDWIVEDTTAWHDNTWGCCRCEKCDSKMSYNYLGQSLMQVRSWIRGDEGIPIYLDDKVRDIQCEFNFDDEDMARMVAEGTWNHTLNLINRRMN